MAQSANAAAQRELKLALRRKAWREYSINWELYLMALLPVIWLIVFRYLPMYGNVIAFMRFVASKGIWGSPWIGFANFERFFTSFKFGNIMWNTFFLNAYDLVLGFPIPIILAILLHYTPFQGYKKTVQMVTYAPPLHLHRGDGGHHLQAVLAAHRRRQSGAHRARPAGVQLPRLAAVVPAHLRVDQHLAEHGFPFAIGVWNVIITRTYLQSNIPGELYEAARVDGATNTRMLWSVVLPLSGPIIAVITLFYAVNHWNQFFNALVYIRRQELRPLQIILREILVLNSPGVIDQLMASASPEQVEALQARMYLQGLIQFALIVVATAPILAVYPFVQKYFVRGVMIGALKG